MVVLVAAWMGLAVADDAPITVGSVVWKTQGPLIYPLEAQLFPVPATVTCPTVVTVEADGRVREVEVTGCRGAMARGARQTLRTWKATPVMYGGKAVRALTPVDLRMASPISEQQLREGGVGWSAVDWSQADCDYLHPSRININVRTELPWANAASTSYDAISCPFLARVDDGHVSAMMFFGCDATLRQPMLDVMDQWRFEAHEGCALVPSVATHRDLTRLDTSEAELAPLVEVQAGELYNRKRMDATYPSAALAAKYADAVCLVGVTVQADGVPYRVGATNCPGPLKKAAEAAAAEWRWSEPMVEGKVVRATTEILVMFGP